MISLEEILKLLSILTPIVTAYLVYLNRKQARDQQANKSQLLAADQAIDSVRDANTELRTELDRQMKDRDRERENLRSTVANLQGAMEEQRRYYVSELDRIASFWQRRLEEQGQALLLANITIETLRSRIAELEKLVNAP